MLYIGNTSKSAEDRSTRSVVDVYKTRYAQLDMEISNIRDSLLNERDLVEKLQDRLKEDKQRLQDALDEERKDFNNSGINKNSELDELQRILDESDKELDDIGRGIDTGITCLSSCQTCFDVTYSSCNECQSTVQQTCPSTYSSCNECQSCNAAYCADEYSSCTTEAQTCSSCYVVSNNPSPCSYSSCDTCVSGYTVTVCTSGNTSTVCTSCVTCQACDGTENECTSTTQTGCWSTEQIGCTECVGVEYSGSHKCETSSYSSCVRWEVGCTLFFGGTCTDAYAHCNLVYGDGTTIHCKGTYSEEETSCEPSYILCTPHGTGGYQECSGDFTVRNDSCSGYSSDTETSTQTCEASFNIGTVTCERAYQSTEEHLVCGAGYLGDGSSSPICEERYQVCSAGVSNFCVGGYSTAERGMICDPCFLVNGGCTSECYSCDGGSQAEICTSGNTTTTCTSCDEGLADCPSCYTTTYTECESCVSGNHNAQALIDICTDAYDACGTTFANCYDTSSCTNGFAEAAGCEAGEGCGACQTACQSCDTCQAVCESTTQGCTGGVGCDSCYPSCNTTAQSCTTCYGTVYECHGTTYGSCSGCVSCLAAFCACGHSTNY